MCGRYTLTRQEKLIEEMEATLGARVEASPWWRPRFNVAPTQPAPVVVLRDGTRQLEMMRWGLVPHWATGTGGDDANRKQAKPPLMINARAESVRHKAVYRDAFERRRCLVPADGFFEWKREGKQALPLYFRPEPPRIVAFAGIWTRAVETTSFAILTGPPNRLVAPIHDRMPVVLDPGAYAAWLDPATAGDAAHALLHTPEIGDWRADFVSTRVNAAANDDPACIEPAQHELPAQGSLF